MNRDDEELALQVASDGGIASLRSVLDRLDHESIEVGSLAIHAEPRRRLLCTHRPHNLDGGHSMTTQTYALRDTATMLRRKTCGG